MAIHILLYTFLGIEYHIWADWISAVFVTLTIILCALQMRNHFLYPHKQETRRNVLRILLMVIVYSIEAVIGLYTKGVSAYADCLRDTYEALVIYAFYQLLIDSLGGETKVIESFHESYVEVSEDYQISTQVESSLHDDLLDLVSGHRRVQHHVWPMNYCMKPWDLNEDFVTKTRFGVLQYCFVQPVCALVAFIMKMTHTFGEGQFKWNVGYPYEAFVKTVSQCWAIYCLVLFYLAIKHQPHESEMGMAFAKLRVVPKFLCIKGVVFFTYWQSVGIAALVYFGMIKPTKTWSTENIAVGTQDFMIVIEMLLFSFAHAYAFKVTDFGSIDDGPMMKPHEIVGDMVNVKDIFVDAPKKVIESSNLLGKRKSNGDIVSEDSDSEGGDGATATDVFRSSGLNLKG